jgi:hypothetical protein
VRCIRESQDIGLKSMMEETNSYIYISIRLTILVCQCKLGFSKYLQLYHHTNGSTLSTPFCRQREDY